MFNLASPRTPPFFRAMLFWLKKFVSFWLMPLPFCLTLLIVGICLVRSARRPKLGRALLIAATLLLLLFTNKTVSTWLVRPLERRYPAIPEFRAGEPLPPALAACRFVVVLGGGNGNTPGLSAVNELSTSSLSRLTEAVRLLRLMPEAHLVLSGPPDGNHPSHATMMARAAQSLGIPLERVTLIEKVDDTEDESLAVKKLAGSAPFVLVTSAWHMPRAMALFRSAGLAPLPGPADFTAHPDGQFFWGSLLCDTGSLDRSTFAIHEYFGYLWIWLRGKT